MMLVGHQCSQQKILGNYNTKDLKKLKKKLEQPHQTIVTKSIWSQMRRKYTSQKTKELMCCNLLLFLWGSGSTWGVTCGSQWSIKLQTQHAVFWDLHLTLQISLPSLIILTYRLSSPGSVPCEFPPCGLGKHTQSDLDASQRSCFAFSTHAGVYNVEALLKTP